MLDFDSSSDVAILNTLADPSNYGGCTVNAFQSDSWIPSITEGSISCTSGLGNDADDIDCPSQTEIRAGSSGSGGGGTCFGCMGSQSILPISDGGAGVAVDLKARYTGGGACDTWADEMQNVYDNFYGVKETQFVTNNVLSRGATALLSVSDYTTAVTTVGNTFDTALTNLDASFSSIVHPTYGLLAGLNCRLFG